MGLLTSFTNPSAVNPNPYVETFPPTMLQAGGAILANQLWLFDVDIINNPIALAKFRIWIVLQSGNVDVGLFSSDGTTATLVGSSGSTAVGAAGEQVITLATPPVQRPGIQHYLGICPDNVTATFGRMTSSAYNMGKVGPVFANVSRTSSFPLATNATSFALADLVAGSNRFWLRASAT